MLHQNYIGMSLRIKINRKAIEIPIKPKNDPLSINYAELSQNRILQQIENPISLQRQDIIPEDSIELFDSICSCWSNQISDTLLSVAFRMVILLNKVTELPSPIKMINGTKNNIILHIKLSDKTAYEIPLMTSDDASNINIAYPLIINILTDGIMSPDLVFKQEYLDETNEKDYAEVKTAYDCFKEEWYGSQNGYLPITNILVRYMTNLWLHSDNIFYYKQLMTLYTKSLGRYYMNI